MKTSYLNKKLILQKSTVTVLTGLQTIKGGNGKNDTYTVRTTTITAPDDTGS